MKLDNFSLMTFNIRFGLAPDTDNSWDKRKDILLKTVLDQSPDFIGFQEANNFQLSFLKKNLKNYSNIGEYQFSDSKWQDIPIFFKRKWNCIYTDHFFLSETPEKESKFKNSIWPRQGVTSLFHSNNRFICITNTHFDFSDSVQVKSAELIKKKINFFTDDVPKLICGDFNSDPTGICYNQFTSTHNRDYFKDPFKNIHTPTFHGFKGVPHKGRIDWILYRGKIEPQQKEIIRYSLNGKYPSDHFPVIVNFNFKKDIKN